MENNLLAEGGGEFTYSSARQANSREPLMKKRHHQQKEVLFRQNYDGSKVRGSYLGPTGDNRLREDGMGGGSG